MWVQQVFEPRIPPDTCVDMQCETKSWGDIAGARVVRRDKRAGTRATHTHTPGGTPGGHTRRTHQADIHNQMTRETENYFRSSFSHTCCCNLEARDMMASPFNNLADDIQQGGHALSILLLRPCSPWPEVLSGGLPSTENRKRLDLQQRR